MHEHLYPFPVVHICVCVRLRVCKQAEGAELDNLQQLHDGVYQQAREWYQRLGRHIQDQISRRFGSMPEKEDNIQVRLTHTHTHTHTESLS